MTILLKLILVQEYSVTAVFYLSEINKYNKQVSNILSLVSSGLWAAQDMVHLRESTEKVINI